MSYSAQDIQDAFACAGYHALRTGQNTQAMVFAHLEGRCPCDVNRCPECRERGYNGTRVHKVNCSMLKTTFVQCSAQSLNGRCQLRLGHKCNHLNLASEEWPVYNTRMSPPSGDTQND